MARRSAAQMGMAGARGEIVARVLADQPLRSHAGLTVRFHDPTGRGGRPSTNARLVGPSDQQSCADFFMRNMTATAASSLFRLPLSAIGIVCGC
jgi:hypothetical protein